MCQESLKDRYCVKLAFSVQSAAEIDSSIALWPLFRLVPGDRRETSSVEVSSVEVDMLFDATSHEEEAMVVPFVPVKAKVGVPVCPQGLQETGPVQALSKLIIRGDVNEARRHREVATLRVKEINGRVVGTSFHASEERLKCSLAPHVNLRGLADRGHSGDGTISTWVLGGQDQGAISTHAEASDGFALWTDVEVSLDDGRQLLSDIVVHVEVLVPWGLRSVAVVTSTVASGPVGARVRASLIDTSGARVWEDHRDVALLGICCEA